MTAPRPLRIPNWLADKAAGVEPEAPEDEMPDIASLRAEAWLRACPPRFTDATIDTLNHPAGVVSKLTAWTEEARRGIAPNLMLLGPVGRGKTFAALACARAVFLAGKPVRFVPVVEMLDALRPDGGGDVEEYLTPDLLVLDDLGGEKPSDWTVERLYLVINRRWLEKRPVIVTTNHEPTELRELLGERIVDRLRDGAVVLRLGGEASRRG